MSKQLTTKRAPGPGKKSTATVEQAAYTDEELLKAHSDDIYEDETNGITFSKTPFVVFTLFWAFLFIGGMYFDWNNDDFSTYAYMPDTSGVIEEGPFDPLIAGPKLYKTNCASCHQANGMGLPGAFPPLGGSEWVNADEELIIKIVLKGLQGPITVKGQEYNSAMNAFEILSDEEIGAVVSYVRTNFGNTAETVSAEKVTEVRAAIDSRTAQWTAEELLKEHPLK